MNPGPLACEASMLPLHHRAIQGAADNISQEELCILNNIHTFRRSFGGNSAKVAGEDFITCDAHEGTTDAVTDVSDVVEEARFEQATTLPVGTGDSGAAAVELVADASMETALDTEISVLLEKSHSKSSKNETNLEDSLASQIAPVVDRSTGAVSKQRVNTAFRDALKS